MVSADPPPEKPSNIAQYSRWLIDQHGVRVDEPERNYYGSAVRALHEHLESSDFWKELKRQLPEFDDRYYQSTGVYLLMKREPPIVDRKPFKSIVDKTFRKNVLLNPNWPESPPDGWVLPDNWLTKIPDVIRTFIVAKYLDGVTYLADSIVELCTTLGRAARVDYEAREEGYYAVHVYVNLPAEIPLRKWDTQAIEFTLELQITTQMQEAIRNLTHPFYVERRSKSRQGPVKKWQWDYQSEEFKANYLAHTVHHIEGLIMDVRTQRS